LINVKTEIEILFGVSLGSRNFALELDRPGFAGGSNF